LEHPLLHPLSVQVGLLLKHRLAQLSDQVVSAHKHQLVLLLDLVGLVVAEDLAVVDLQQRIFLLINFVELMCNPQMCLDRIPNRLPDLAEVDLAAEGLGKGAVRLIPLEQMFNPRLFSDRVLSSRQPVDSEGLVLRLLLLVMTLRLYLIKRVKTSSRVGLEGSLRSEVGLRSPSLDDMFFE
jgi:hypothetical protein